MSMKDDKKAIFKTNFLYWRKSSYLVLSKSIWAQSNNIENSNYTPTTCTPQVPSIIHNKITFLNILTKWQVWLELTLITHNHNEITWKLVAVLMELYDQFYSLASHGDTGRNRNRFLQTYHQISSHRTPNNLLPAISARSSKAQLSAHHFKNTSSNSLLSFTPPISKWADSLLLNKKPPPLRSEAYSTPITHNNKNRRNTTFSVYANLV